MKKYKIIAEEIVTYEIVVEAQNFDDACVSWHEIAKERDYQVKEKEWKTKEVKNI
tara:strand:- start:44 stop:208 length:165 start_codon:yes stop_codon:yes gene_type:complete